MKHIKKIFIIEWDEFEDSVMTIDSVTLEKILDCSIAGCRNIKIKLDKDE